LFGLRFVNSEYIDSLVLEVQSLRAERARLLDALFEAKNVPVRLIEQKQETQVVGGRMPWPQKKALLEQAAYQKAHGDSDTN
jgi:hypothetical protein